MKKLFICLAFIGMLAACTSKTTKTEVEAVDSTIVDSIVVDSVIIDSVQ